MNAVARKVTGGIKKEEKESRMLKQITIADKTFVRYIDQDEINNIVYFLAKKVNSIYKGKDLVIMGVLNGSFMVLSDLVKQISENINTTVTFIKVSSYEGGVQTKGKVSNLLGLDIDIAGKNVLIVEDILDTLVTINCLKLELLKCNPLTLNTIALLSKRQNPGENIIYGKLIADEFVIGYGMDYKGMGRNLKDIYKLKV